MTTADKVLNRILASHCIHCGVKLPESGVQCPSCSGLPPLLRGEAIEMLSQPGELSRENAREAMEDAETKLQAFMDQAAQVDYHNTTAQLETVENQLNQDLGNARETLKTADARLKKRKQPKLRPGSRSKPLRKPQRKRPRMSSRPSG